MAFFETLIGIFQVHTNLAYLLIFLGSFFETLIGTGFFVYGEIFFLSGSILAGLGYLNIWLVALFAISGGIIGDNCSYLMGRKYGHLILRRFFKKSNRFLTPQNYNQSKKLFHSHGKKTLFLARFMGPLSWVTPFFAGTFKVKYKEFLMYNTPGVIAGIGLFLVAGYFFGFSYNLILSKILKDISYIILILFAIIAYFILARFGVFDKLWQKILKIFKN